MLISLLNKFVGIAVIMNLILKLTASIQNSLKIWFEKIPIISYTSILNFSYPTNFYNTINPTKT